MGTVAVVIFLVLVFAFAATARALLRIDVSAPMAFVAAGALLSLATRPSTRSPRRASPSSPS